MKTPERLWVWWCDNCTYLSVVTEPDTTACGVCGEERDGEPSTEYAPRHPGANSAVTGEKLQWKK